MSSDDLQAIITLRCTGQYSAALLALSTHNSKHVEYITEQCSILERAQCHFELYQFAELSSVIAEIRKQPNCEGTKEEALINLLEAYMEVHANLKLQEAIVIADGIYAKWLGEKTVQDFDDVDISLLCFHHTLKGLGQRLLFDTPEPAEIKILRRIKMDSLRERLLQDGQLDRLAMIHTAEATTQPSEVQIPRLRQTISLLDENAGAMRVHLVILLTQALHENGDFELAWSELAAIEAPQMPTSGSERGLWGEYLRLQEVSVSEGIHAAENLCGRFEDQGNRRGVLLCHVRTAEILISTNNTQLYRVELEAILRDIKSYSSLEFWLLYTQHFFKEDMNDRKRLGIAISFCEQFFTLHKECSIPELEYMLAASLADCYEELGDMHHALHWRVSAKDFAHKTDDQSIRDEAEYQVQTTLADASIIAADDPHGVKQPEWKSTQKADLEIKYWDSKAEGKYEYQYAYAFDLFQKELGDEIKLKKYPCGQIWLGRLNEALDLIPENKYEERPRIAFTLGHSKFVFGDFDGALETLTDAFQQATTAGNDEYGIARIALFTKSRVYLHQYLSARSIKSFEACRATLQESQDRSEKRGKIDEIACCHVVGAVLWHAKGIADPAALKTALHHISEAERLWNEEREALFTKLGLDSLTSKYSLRGRNESNQYSILGLAIEICFQLEHLPEAWKWIEYAKARAFLDDLDTERTSLPRTDGMFDTHRTSQHPLSTLDEPALLVHWIFVGESIYMMTRRGETEFQKFKLDITASTVKEWYRGIMSTREDYRDPDTALDLLSELGELCRPLSNPDFVRVDELLILCPTQTLFKIPLHAIPIYNGITLLDRSPIMYTHSFGVLQECLRRASRKCSEIPGPHFFGNPTEDTPAGEKSILALEKQYGGEIFLRGKATRAIFLSKSPDSKFVHFHGHVISALHPLNKAMLFHAGEELKVREVFEMNLHSFNPFISLIACGSGAERLEVGDEPLGFISSFLYAGASSVLATLWPINDELSGAAFSNVFYGLDVTHTFNPKEVVDLSKRLRIAALSIKARSETAAPYFWAAFVIHGNWRVTLN